MSIFILVIMRSIATFVTYLFMDIFGLYSNEYITTTRVRLGMPHSDESPPHLVSYRICVRTRISYVRPYLSTVVNSQKFRKWVDETSHNNQLIIHNIWLLDAAVVGTSVDRYRIRYIATDINRNAVEQELTVY